jgi:hypothetical protein
VESEVPQTPPFPRSELDAAFDVSRSGRWMVVQSMSPEAWGYVVWPIDGAHRIYGFGVSVALGMS